MFPELFLSVVVAGEQILPHKEPVPDQRHDKRPPNDHTHTETHGISPDLIVPPITAVATPHAQMSLPKPVIILAKNPSPSPGRVMIGKPRL